MKPVRLLLFCAYMLLCLTAGVARAVVYKATLLNPPSGYYGSVAEDVVGNIRVGHASVTITGNGQTDLRALLWNGTNVVNLHPSRFLSSIAKGVSGNAQVGYAVGAGFYYHALMWTGTADSAVELTPTLYYDSIARGILGDAIVGEGRDFTTRAIHALLWHGADTVTDLHPPINFAYSYAAALSETKQYGYGATNGSNMHALLWRGSAASYSDLNPAGFAASKIVAGTETTQVGTAYLSADLRNPHAFLWHDTASSALDLHPSGFLGSSADGAFGDHQVGWGASNFSGKVANHALLWHGSANDFVDLHQYLTNLPIAFTDSYAYGIDGNGNIVGFGYDGNDMPHAVLWTPIPEPHSGLALFFGMVGLRLAPYRKRA